MDISWLIKFRLKLMNKVYRLSRLCVANVLTCVFDSWDKLLGPPKTKVVITVVKTCMMVVSWLRELHFEIITSVIHSNWRICGYSKDITLDIVISMSHWLLTKLLSFVVDIMNEIRVIKVHTYMTNHTQLIKHQWTIRVWINLH